MVRARHVVRTRASEYPWPYLTFARRKYPGPSPEVIGPATKLVIDGYTRSASTFAVYALQLAQDEPVRLAHHLHAPAQLIEAAHRHVPTLLVVREPRGAILSQLIREPGVALRDALVAYCRFHDRLTPYVGDFVVGDFRTITTDFGAVVRRLNDRFDLALREPSAADLHECAAFVEQRGALSPTLLGFESGTVSKADARRELAVQQGRTSSVDQREQWKPSDARRRQKEALEQHWFGAALAPLRMRAERAYEAVASAAGPNPPESTARVSRGQHDGR
jgi:hypothetical protein